MREEMVYLQRTANCVVVAGASVTWKAIRAAEHRSCQSLRGEAGTSYSCKKISCSSGKFLYLHLGQADQNILSGNKEDQAGWSCHNNHSCLNTSILNADVMKSGGGFPPKHEFTHIALRENPHFCSPQAGEEIWFVLVGLALLGLCKKYR